MSRAADILADMARRYLEATEQERRAISPDAMPMYWRALRAYADRMLGAAAPVATSPKADCAPQQMNGERQEKYLKRLRMVNARLMADLEAAQARIEDLEREVASLMMREEKRRAPITARAIVRAAADAAGLELERLMDHGRRADAVAARKAAVLAIRLLRPDVSLPVIGRLIGGRDHTTIMHALRAAHDDERVIGLARAAARRIGALADFDEELERIGHG